MFIFFFQAEDGIRDLYVTGVQTCALPICSSTPPAPCSSVPCTSGRGSVASSRRPAGSPGTTGTGPTSVRSEERRVGKECRTRRQKKHITKYYTYAQSRTLQLTQPPRYSTI